MRCDSCLNYWEKHSKVKQVSDQKFIYTFYLYLFVSVQALLVPWANAIAFERFEWDHPSWICWAWCQGMPWKTSQFLHLVLVLHHSLNRRPTLAKAGFIAWNLYEWGKQGEVGRRKLNQATWYIALCALFVQSSGLLLVLTLCLELNFDRTTYTTSIPCNWWNFNRRKHDCNLVGRANHKVSGIRKWCFNDYLWWDCCFNSGYDYARIYV